MANSDPKIGGAYVEIRADTSGLDAGLEQARAGVDRTSVTLSGLQRSMGFLTRAAGTAGRSIASAFAITYGIDALINRSDRLRERLDSIGQATRNLSREIVASFSGGATPAAKQFEQTVRQTYQSVLDANERASKELTGAAGLGLRQLGLAPSRDDIVREVDSAGRAASDALIRARKAAAEAEAKQRAAQEKRAADDRQKFDDQTASMAVGLLDERAQIEAKYALEINKLWRAASEEQNADVVSQIAKRIDVLDRLEKAERKAFDARESDAEAKKAAQAAQQIADAYTRGAEAAERMRDAVRQTVIDTQKMQDAQQAGFGFGDFKTSLDGIKRSVDALRGQIR